jgi:DNA replication protein DnaC
MNTTVLMPTNHIDEQLRLLRMPHAKTVLADLLADARAQRWDPGMLVSELLQHEIRGRKASMLNIRKRQANLPHQRTFESWDETLSSIPLQTQTYLRTLEWIHKRENLILCGPTGTGKSFLAEALASQAIENEMRATWLALDDLGQLVNAHRRDGTIEKTIKKLASTDLIIIDDIGLLPVSEQAAEGFYRLVDAAYEKRSLIITSNMHPANFDTIMPKTLATATVDRLLHHVHICQTKGDSIRLTQSLQNTRN